MDEMFPPFGVVDSSGCPSDFSGKWEAKEIRIDREGRKINEKLLQLMAKPKHKKVFFYQVMTTTEIPASLSWKEAKRLVLEDLATLKVAVLCFFDTERFGGCSDYWGPKPGEERKSRFFRIEGMAVISEKPFKFPSQNEIRDLGPNKTRLILLG